VIKKSVFEEDLIQGMDQELRSIETGRNVDGLVRAADYLHSAMELLEETGLSAQAEEVFQVLAKFAAKHKAHKAHNGHTHGLTSERMIENLKHHGTVFNLTDDGSVDDLLNAEIGGEGLEVSEKEADGDLDFEDEI
jgi:hypothetical protein